MSCTSIRAFSTRSTTTPVLRAITRKPLTSPGVAPSPSSASISENRCDRRSLSRGPAKLLHHSTILLLRHRRGPSDQAQERRFCFEKCERQELLYRTRRCAELGAHGLRFLGGLGARFCRL